MKIEVEIKKEICSSCSYFCELENTCTTGEKVGYCMAEPKANVVFEYRMACIYFKEEKSEQTNTKETS